MRERQGASGTLSQIEDALDDDAHSARSDEFYGRGKANGRDLSPGNNSARRAPSPLATTAPTGLLQAAAPDDTDWPKRDEVPELRRWTSDEQSGVAPASDGDGAAGATSNAAQDSRDQEPPSLVAGTSTDSLQYAEDWDEFSMASESSPLRRTRSKGGGSLGREESNTSNAFDATSGDEKK